MKHLVVLSLFLAAFVDLSLQQTTTQAPTCVQGVNCIAPACRCMSTTNPANLPPNNIPQIVFLNFNGGITKNQEVNYTNIFLNRVNPNGCAVTATFFLSFEYTDFSVVNKLYNRGHEIADFTFSASHYNTDYWKNKDYNSWKSEITDLITATAKYANIPASTINGFRCPYLQSSGDSTYRALADLPNMRYDTSFPTHTLYSPPIWPYTLDFGMRHDCNVQPCPKNSYPGLWTIPIIAKLNANGSRESLTDAWHSPSKEETYQYLMSNFINSYNFNKAPFGIDLNANSWFNMNETSHRLDGLIQFLNELQNMNDVYIVSMSKAIDWLRNPQSLTASATGAFACPSISPRSCLPTTCYYDRDSTPSEVNGDRTMFTCGGCPDSYPWVGNPNGN